MLWEDLAITCHALHTMVGIQQSIKQPLSKTTIVRIKMHRTIQNVIVVKLWLNKDVEINRHKNFASKETLTGSSKKQKRIKLHVVVLVPLRVIAQVQTELWLQDHQTLVRIIQPQEAQVHMVQVVPREVRVIVHLQEAQATEALLQAGVQAIAQAVVEVIHRLRQDADANVWTA